jgi:hypothetical protein
MLMDWQNQHSKNVVLQKATYTFNIIHIKIPMTFITEIKKTYLKVHLEAQETANSQGNIQQTEQCWRYHNIQLQTILQTIAIKTSWYCHKMDIKTSGIE